MHAVKNPVKIKKSHARHAAMRRIAEREDACCLECGKKHSNKKHTGLCDRCIEKSGKLEQYFGD